MNFKRFHESKNLFPQDSFSGKSNDIRIQFNDVASGIVFNTGQYVFTAKISTELTSGVFKFCYTYTDDSQEKSGWISKSTSSTKVVSNANKTIKSISITDYNSYGDITLSEIMLNTGSTPLPYEPYSSEVWHDIPHYIHNTSTDTITTPADIYANDNNATVGLKGNMEQNGTPTPDSLIQPQECGDLETTGEHTGQYKIPILSANTTTPVYLGEVETTRKIKKLVFDGTENWVHRSGDPPNVFFLEISNINFIDNLAISTHYLNQDSGSFDDLQENHIIVRISLSGNKTYIGLRDSNFPATPQGVNQLKEWLAQQYAAGTPVCVWYVLVTPETAVVNEPLRKIGDYVDTVSGITIPVIAGANTISVDTQVQPSEVSINYKGWHPVTDVHEAENGAWT